ncbi:hypothetical protein ACHQM5_005936 [Ranunculus cassubicifolius]
MERTKPIIQNTIKELYSKTLPQCFTMADLGCSSGPNSLLVIASIIDAIREQAQKLGSPLPEFHAFLNDLVGNDFNTLFQFIQYFYEETRKNEGANFPQCFVAAVPGSYYQRLFPSNSLFFVHSCYSVHFLSQVPLGIESNNENIYIAKTSPPCVLKAYLNQFQNDFSTFLRLRSEEMVEGGRMVLTLLGRKSEDPSSKECCRFWELLAKSLQDMVIQGLVEEGKLASFNVPWFAPSCTELRKIIGNEGSFQLDLLETFEANWDASDVPENEDFVFNNITSAESVANTIRAVSQSMIVDHFGEEIINHLFHRYAKHVSDQLLTEKIKFVNLVICMTKIV